LIPDATASLGVITINVDPSFQIGPLILAWHGLMIAVGIIAGAWLAMRFAHEQGLQRDELLNLVALLILGGIVGSRLLYLLFDQPGDLLAPGEWLGTQGFAFYGALILGPLAVGAYLWRGRLSLRYLHALAAGFPLGMAVGRIGDLISGEHYGPPSTLPWAIHYPDPGAEVPNHALAYHSGGLYEIVLALLMLAVLWPLRHRFRWATALFWATVAFYSAGRFLMFFWRSDTTDLGFGLNLAQLTSVALLAVALAGLALARRAHSLGQPPAAEAPS